MQHGSVSDVKFPTGGELLEAQEQTGQPWSRRMNWLLGKPSESGWGFRFVLSLLLLFQVVIIILLHLSPAFGSPESWFEIALGIGGLVLLPVSLAWLWSALKLRAYKPE